MDINVVFKNHSYLQIEADTSIIFELRDFFSFDAPGYKYNNKYKYGTWDGKIRLMDANGYLPTGLWKYVEKFAKNMDYSLDIDEKFKEVSDTEDETIDAWISSLTIMSNGEEITPHWYQKDAVKYAIKYGRGILNLPTSAGKSLIQALICKWYLGRGLINKCLIIVPTKGLVDQMIDDFCDYDLFEPSDMLGIKGGTAKDANRPIYVTTWQSAVKQPTEWFEQFGLAMNDECHLSTGKSISGMVQAMSGCPYKFGLTGTLKDGKANILQYIGLFGSIYKPVTTKELMDEGKVTNLKINPILLKYPDQECRHLGKLEYAEEIKYITNHTKRNNWICKLATKLSGRNENTLVMFKHIAHGKDLAERLKKIYDPEKVFFIAGETKDDDRNRLKKIAENTSGLIIVASYGVMSTGVSIKNLHNVIFAHPTKSKIINLQTIGRILRKHESKVVATLFDIVDVLAQRTKPGAKSKFKNKNYAFKHGLERISLYNREKFDYNLRQVDL